MTKLTTFIFRTTIRVPEGERAILFKDGLFMRFLMPGKYVLNGFGKPYTVHGFSLSDLRFRSDLQDVILRDYAKASAAHLTCVETTPNEVALVTRAGRLFAVIAPEKCDVFWADAGPWEVEMISTADDLRVADSISKRLLLINTALVKRFKVDHGHIGLLYLDGAFKGKLLPGAHTFWNTSSVVTMKMIDVREHALDVAGQEVLTKDRVSIRVNLTATYRVVDPVKAVSDVKDFEDTLYRALAHAFRKSLSVKTLDEVLAKKGVIDDEAAKAVKASMAKAGLSVAAITLKDVILPGDMRDILNTVVSAHKEAEANVIRRREETAATRALLNTAKVMADNPAMLRLKELEALEAIADKVGNLTVHSGAKGLLDDIVSLSPKP